ncbi:hypothetical protein [Streptomyces syringium]|uniref:hypothetical protein n=1 Tax=Streptomyces syringium TaxID=76729 RepID=UPI0037CD124B
MAAIPARQWAVVEANLLCSVDAMHALRRAGGNGPVLADSEAGLAWWLTPVDAVEYVVGTSQGLTVQPPSWKLLCPPVEYGYGGRCWMEKPDGTGKLTAPAALVAEFRSSSTACAARQGRLPGR